MPATDPTNVGVGVLRRRRLVDEAGALSKGEAAAKKIVGRGGTQQMATAAAVAAAVTEYTLQAGNVSTVTIAEIVQSACTIHGHPKSAPLLAAFAVGYWTQKQKLNVDDTRTAASGAVTLTGGAAV